MRIASTFILSVATIIGLATTSDVNAKACTIKITSPQHQSTVKPYPTLSSTGQYQIDVDVNVRACKLAPDEKVYLFMKVLGGRTWWAPSNPVGPKELVRNQASFGLVGIGSPQINDRTFRILAGVTADTLDTGGSTYTSLPPFRGQDTITVMR